MLRIGNLVIEFNDSRFHEQPFLLKHATMLIIHFVRWIKGITLFQIQLNFCVVLKRRKFP